MLSAAPLHAIETDERERRAHAVVAAAQLVGGDPYVVVCAQRGDHLLLLEGPAQAPPRAGVRREAEQRLAVRVDAALGRLHEAAEHVEEGRLAGAVGTDEAAHPGRQLERDAVERPDAAERDGQGAHVKHRRPSRD